MENNTIQDNKHLSLGEALVPVVFLMALLAYNIFYADGAWLGDYSNQYILLIAGGIAAVMGFFNKVTGGLMIQEILENLKSVLIPICILILVGA